MDRATTLNTPLFTLAHARTGDKGNRSNISLIAFRPELYQILVEQITEDAVARHFASRMPSRVARYLLPNLHAINFVLDDVLDGGVNGSLNLDSHGKALAFHLLELNIVLPLTLKPHLAGPSNT